MKRNTPIIIFAVAILLLGGQLSFPLQRASLQSELAQLVQRGLTYRFLDDTMVQITDPLSGDKQLKSLQEPREADIRAWATARGIPIMEIDPSTIDTTQYAGRYRYWTRVPASTPSNDFPVMADVDRNGLLENYGVTVDTVFPYNGYMQIYEVDAGGSPVLRYTYPPPPFSVKGITDIDRNGLSELCILQSGLHTMKFFEQPSKLQLPTSLRFTYVSTNTESGDPTMTPYFGSLDSDSAMDCLHVISEPDSDSTGTTAFKITVAEFDSTINNLNRVWSLPIPPTANLGFFTDAVTVGDFDSDGKMEFATTTAIVRPTFFIFENNGDNSYHLAYQEQIADVTNYSNLGSGDIDGDGKPEIFSCATISTGNWTFVHEADSDDQYSIKLIIHILAGGTFDSPVYFAKDMDGDSKPELVFTAGEYLMMLKRNGDNQYRIFFVMRLLGQENILLSDFDHDGLIDIAVGKYERVPPATRSTYFTDLYLRDKAVSVGERQEFSSRTSSFLSSYPNPFNPSTTIKYGLPSRGHVKLLLYDATGRLLSTLVDQTQEAGAYTLDLNGRGMASGIYFCQLRTFLSVITRKLLLIR